jgi:spectinomycin phosphotransferase
MIEKPAIKDEAIIDALNESYSIQANHVTFLPIGNDATAFSYRVETENENLYFLKIKTKLSNPAALYVPRFLKDHGIEQVIAPLPTHSQELLREMDGVSLILYPFIYGREAMEDGMSDSQWKEFGSILKRIHSTKLPSAIEQYVKRETFIPKWFNLAKELHEQINTQIYEDRHQKELAAFWKEKNETIQTLLERVEKLGKYLQRIDLDFVLCHADIHTANILIASAQTMFIVDWDETLLAPKERDLMFVHNEDANQIREEQMFFNGYGNVKMNELVLAYYRYEWCVQEIGDYGERVFLTKDIGESTKQNSLEGFMELFSQHDVIQVALNTLSESELRNNS